MGKLLVIKLYKVSFVVACGLIMFTWVYSHKAAPVRGKVVQNHTLKQLFAYKNDAVLTQKFQDLGSHPMKRQKMISQSDNRRI